MWKWLIAAAVILAVNDILLFYIQRKRRMKELGYVAAIIDEARKPGGSGAEGETAPEAVFSEFEDTQLSRIVHRLSKLQERFEGQKAEISRDRDEVRKLIAEIAHQLRTPLANMEAYLELLRGAETEEERQLYIEAIADSEAKIHFLAESFVKMARLESKVIQIRKESLDLGQTLAAAVNLAGRQAQKKQITVRTEISGGKAGEAFTVPHDANWLGEAIYNLLDNAVKYSPEGAVVEIAAERSEMSVRIRVRDYGTGIEAGEESRIFKRFYRGKNVGAQEGYGLGLYLAREIVTRHDGYVRVKRMEKGSVFEICIPV